MLADRIKSFFHRLKKSESSVYEALLKHYINIQTSLSLVQIDFEKSNKELISSDPTKTSKELRLEIYKEIKSYDNSSWLHRLWCKMSGKSKLIEKKRSWLTFQRYKKLLRGNICKEPILDLPLNQHKKLALPKSFLSSRIKFNLQNYINELDKINVDGFTLAEQEDIASKLMKLGETTVRRHDSYIKRKPKVPLTNKFINFLQSRTNEKKHIAYRFLFLCGFFNLDIFNVTQDIIIRHHYRIQRNLGLSKHSHAYKDLLHYSTTLSADLVMLKGVTTNDWEKMLSDKSETYQEAYLEGRKVFGSYSNSVKEDQVNAARSCTDLVTLGMNSNSKQEIQQPVITNNKSIEEFLHACGFYDIELNEESLKNLKKAQRQIHLKIHPDKIVRTIQDDQHGSIEFRTNSLQNYESMRNELFSSLKKYFNISKFENKKVIYQSLSEKKIQICINYGKKLRLKFNNNLEIAEQIYELATARSLMKHDFDYCKKLFGEIQSYIKVLKEAESVKDMTIVSRVNFFKNPLLSARPAFEKLQIEVRRRNSI